MLLPIKIKRNIKVKLLKPKVPEGLALPSARKRKKKKKQ